MTKELTVPEFGQIEGGRIWTAGGKDGRAAFKVQVSDSAVQELEPEVFARYLLQGVDNIYEYYEKTRGKSSFDFRKGLQELWDQSKEFTP